MDAELAANTFVLGIMVAEHAHGIRRTGDDGKTDAIYETLRLVANGDLTLLNTPEELIASLPTPPGGIELKIGPEFYELLRQSRENQKRTAQIVANALPQ